MDEERQGIYISGKEMYESIQAIGSTSQQILTRISVMEAKLEDFGQTEERSREAIRKSEEAYDIASKIESQQVWLWRIVSGSLVTGAITLLLSFIKKSI
ncbi:Haemolysin XhlA [Thermoactinomyces sp. DSM 45891]|uniref:hypothetical protein n=1 Tax=Thermoactinomyces sp. DSM 45891 TaxID=1761907 RepID=UPI00091B4DCC|nr:hypothetical protein [Thermoactinomyces sp. DSM 45891]SFX83562.1 Haemolysin XhlA [Thermoactinomyces sp. DSM 45891]